MFMRVFGVLVVAFVFVAESADLAAQNAAAAPPAELSPVGALQSGPGQESSSPPAASEGSNAAQGAVAFPGQTVLVPAGTAIPLTLVSPIKSRSTKPGDSVRATVAFPVTTGTQLAIPAGTYVEGTVTRLVPHTLESKLPEVEIRFMRMLFANGYAVDLDANSEQGIVEDPEKKSRARDSAMNDRASVQKPAGSFSLLGQQPTQPTLPQVHQPNLAAIAGATMGAAAAFGIGMLVWAHHRATHTDYVLFDSGWQFQMVLTKPLTLDTSRVEAAASTPRAQ